MRFVCSAATVATFVLALSSGSLAMQEAKGGNAEAAKVKNPVSSTPDSIAAGGTTFKRRCAACHGTDAKGGPPKEDFMAPGANLVDDKYDHGSSDGEIFYVIKNGVPPELVMDAWGERLSDTEIWNVINFLRDAQKNPSRSGAAAAPSGGAASAAGGKTTKDGVYSEEQAVKGKTSYNDKCGACHGEDLTGGGFAPALAGEGFLAGWKGQKLDSLFSRIKDTMPADKPNSMSGDQTAEIVAYILKVNKAPAGAAMSTDGTSLAQVTIAAQ